MINVSVSLRLSLPNRMIFFNAVFGNKTVSNDLLVLPDSMHGQWLVLRQRIHQGSTMSYVCPGKIESYSALERDAEKGISPVWERSGLFLPWMIGGRTGEEGYCQSIREFSATSSRCFLIWWEYQIILVSFAVQRVSGIEIIRSIGLIRFRVGENIISGMTHNDFKAEIPLYGAWGGAFMH